MDLNKLSEFKINGAIDTQFKTNIAVERVLKATGHKVNGGITDWLEFLDTIQTISSILYALLTILSIAIKYTFIGLYRLIKWSYKMNSKLIDKLIKD